MTDATQNSSDEKPKADERLGVITGVRVCAKCGFNLMGQLILREPIYGLIVARCPECGQVAPLQEYPSMGRTARRWNALLGGLWALVVLAGALGVSFALMGLMFGALEIGKEDLESALPGHRWTITVDQAELRDVLRSMGGPFAVINPWVFGFWLGGGALSLVTGVAASIVALGIRGVRLALIPLVVLLVPIIGFSIRRSVVLTQIAGGSAGKYTVAEWLIGPHIVAITLLVFGVMLITGATFGRPLARVLVRILLPPPMRAGLAPLWLTDRKELPRARGW